MSAAETSSTGTSTSTSAPTLAAAGITGTDQSHDPRTGAVSDGVPHTDPAQLSAVVERAHAAHALTRLASPADRAGWLHALADALEARAADLVDIALAETGLSRTRLEGECAKTVANARRYAETAARGELHRAVVDHVAGPPGVDLRRAALSVGPVAVFGASNFPLQFGTLGHDTCSALAAGCPVIVKAHPAHPRLAAALAELGVEALTAAGAPDGALAQVVGFAAGLALVDADAVAAVGFTGSQAGGTALVARAAERRRPIPVYAEMGTVNPAVITPAGAARCSEIAAAFVEAMTLGAGQFCTKPGLLLAPRGGGLPAAVAAALTTAPSTPLLTAGIATAYADGVARLVEAGAEPLATVPSTGEGFAAGPVVLAAQVADIRDGSPFTAEVFGPVGLVVEYDHLDDALAVLDELEPALAASVLAGAGADPDVAAVVDRLSQSVGRVVVDGWTTGVAWSDAMHHGGPWPATSRPEHTSVGGAAVERWLRPCAYQDVPDAALPPALQDANPWRLPRAEHGTVTAELAP